MSRLNMDNKLQDNDFIDSEATRRNINTEARSHGHTLSKPVSIAIGNLEGKIALDTLAKRKTFMD